MKKTISTILSGFISVALVVVIGVLVSPIIAEYEASQAAGELKEMLSDATTFTEVTDILHDVSSYVTNVHEGKDAAGDVVGYVVYTSTTEGFKSDSKQVIVSIDSTGVIVAVKANFPQTDDRFVPHSESYPQTYVGKDGTLAGVEFITNVTLSSKAFRHCVEGAFETLTANDLVKEAVKTPTQILTEAIPSVHTGMASFQNVAKYNSATVTGEHITAAYKALNNSGAAFILVDGDTTILAVVNTSCVATYYGVDTETQEVINVDGSAYANEVRTAAESIVTKPNNGATIAANVDATAAFEEIELSSYSSVIYACTISYNDTTYYGFTTCTVGYENNLTTSTVILTADGKIFTHKSNTYFFGSGVEYYLNAMLPGFDQNNFQNGLVNQSAADFETIGLVGTTTYTSGCVQQSLRDCYALLQSLNN